MSNDLAFSKLNMFNVWSYEAKIKMFKFEYVKKLCSNLLQKHTANLVKGSAMSDVQYYSFEAKKKGLQVQLPTDQHIKVLWTFKKLCSTLLDVR